MSLLPFQVNRYKGARLTADRRVESGELCGRCLELAKVVFVRTSTTEVRTLVWWHEAQLLYWKSAILRGRGRGCGFESRRVY